MAKNTRQSLNVPDAAPPPWHSVLLILTVIVVSIRHPPSLESIDRFATVAAFTTPVLASGGGGAAALAALGLVRLSFALFIFAFVTARVVHPRPIEFSTAPARGSRLRKTALRLSGARRIATFTMWSFLLLGLSFLGSAVITLRVARHGDDADISPWLLRASLLAFEVAAPAGLLVSTVVRYALWPTHLAAQGAAGTVGFRSFWGLVAHNANVAFILAEACLLGGLPVRLEHVAFAPSLGVVYVVFTWWMATRWTTAEGGGEDRGPNFIYFFLDTTLGWRGTLALGILLAVLIVFYAVLSQVNALLARHLGEALLPRLAAAVGLASCVCRFRD